MKEINLQAGELLMIDPCYLESKSGLIQVKLFSVDDGFHHMLFNGKPTGCGVGVDSGEIAIFKAEKDLTLESSDGFSGHLVWSAEMPIENISFLNEESAI